MRSAYRLGVVMGIAAFLWSGPASANMPYFQAYKKAYPKASKPACTVCHLSAMGAKTNLNAYGKALQETKAKPEGATFKRIEAADADKDGVSNGDEIAAGTAPGDPKSVPAKGAPAQKKP